MSRLILLNKPYGVLCQFTAEPGLGLAFARVGLDWQEYVKVDQRYLRPSEVDHLCGDSTKARTVLGWQPDVSFEQLVNRMVDAQMENES